MNQPGRIADVHDVLTGLESHRPPLLSIVIPTRNYARYIGQAIESALGQGHRPTEVIVVDDGSTDETPRVLRTFETAIRVLRLDGRGVSAARNAGLAEAAGEYVLFLDADDVLLPDGPVRQAQLLVQCPGVDVVAGQWYTYDVESGFASRRFGTLRPDEDAFSQLLRSNVVATPSAVMLRRRVLQALGGFDTSLHFTADWELWLRLAKHGRRFARVRAPVAVYRIHGESMTANLDLAIRDTIALLDRSFGDGTLSEARRRID